MPMTRERPSKWLICWVVAWGGCVPQVEVDQLPTARETITEVGQRLGRSISPGKLTEIVGRGDRVLGQLTHEERRALGRNAIRFRADRPVVVEVAAPENSPPFWLSDQGFDDTGDRLKNADGTFILFRKSFPVGLIGLGVNGLDVTARSQYAVFLRAEGGGTVAIEPRDPLDLSTVIARPGVSPYSDVEKPFESLPSRLIGSTIVRTAFERRNEGALARGRVWKTRQPSGPSPDQVVVSFGADPTNTLSITWRTDPSVGDSFVRIAPESSGEAGKIDPKVIRGDAHPVNSQGLLNDPTILRHRAIVEGLAPDTRYAYSVGDGTPNGWTDWRTVQTAPSVLRDFGFLYMGDAQCGLERWGDLLHVAHRRRPDAGFLLLAGDLVDRGNERTNWDHFFLRAAGVFEEIPFMPSVGNHEYLDLGPEIYRGTFDLPANGPAGIDPNLVYSFEYSDAFVAVLDSNLGLYDSRLAKAQTDWLDEALTRTRATWKFVTFHHPVYASHPTRENPPIGEAWGPVFDKHHVDMVLQGHDHAYLRTRPMRAGRPVESPAEGTVYVVSVSGEKFCEQDPRGYTSKGFTNLATYQTIDIQVKPKRLTYRSFDREGREVDSLIIDKGAEAPRLAGASPR
ncbi:fibronectin type III domain-containing protein [Tundrisphaera lichenicola]|uniref:fibronectin type III domain-containing protein n=1 Tax=Tundrisphaera lichenicola TaxID=2029860 RepID=UPI003EB866AE